MQTLILTLHIIVCVLLVILVLLQAGKEGMGVIFGGGGGSVFGSSGAGGILSKLTAFMAVLFLFTCLSYTYVTNVRTDDGSSILNVQLEEIPAPAASESSAPQASETPATTQPEVSEKPQVDGASVTTEDTEQDAPQVQ